VAAYKKVLTEEANSVEAMACVASHLFYNDQPELALLLYRRLLQVPAAFIYQVQSRRQSH